MNIKLKFSLIIIITLIIGAAIGFEISEITIKNRFDEMNNFKEPKGFVKIFEDVIQPEIGQQAAIESILFKYHNKIDSVSKLNMNFVSSIIDSMKAELNKNLKPEQIERLDREMTRMKNTPPPPGEGMPHKQHDGNHPPDHGKDFPPPDNNHMTPPPHREGDKF